MNPLDGMTWEERFHAAFTALLKMEHRAEDAERKLSERTSSMPREEIRLVAPRKVA